MVLKARELLVRQQTQVINALRAHLHELGIIAGAGVAKVSQLIDIARDPDEPRIPAAARVALAAIVGQLNALGQELKRLERTIVTMARRDPDARRLFASRIAYPDAPQFRRLEQQRRGSHAGRSACDPTGGDGEVRHRLLTACTSWSRPLPEMT
jgi:transposase